LDLDYKTLSSEYDETDRSLISNLNQKPTENFKASVSNEQQLAGMVIYFIKENGGPLKALESERKSLIAGNISL